MYNIAQRLKAKDLPFFTLASELANMVEVSYIKETEKGELFIFEDFSQIELVIANNSVIYD